MIDATQKYSCPISQSSVSPIKFNNLLGKADCDAGIISHLRNAVEVISDLDESALPNNLAYPKQSPAYVKNKNLMLVRDSDISPSELKRFRSRLNLKYKDKDALDLSNLKELTQKIKSELDKIITYNYVDRNIKKFESQIENTELKINAIDRSDPRSDQQLSSLSKQLEEDKSKLIYFTDLRDTAKDIHDLAEWFDRTYPNLK
jgi:vacuolar-type H+-ATPase subunit D/Vma8